MVNTIPIKNTAPNATGTLTPCPNTKLNAVNAVKEIAQPIAIGNLAHRPISSEPNAAIKQVAINTPPWLKPASPNMLGTTMTE